MTTEPTPTPTLAAGEAALVRAVRHDIAKAILDARSASHYFAKGEVDRELELTWQRLGRVEQERPELLPALAAHLGVGTVDLAAIRAGIQARTHDLLERRLTIHATIQYHTWGR